MPINHSIDSTTDCNAIRELIADYAFGLSSPADTRWIEANLAQCPDAQAELADFMQIQDAMRAGVDEIEPPAALADRLLTAISPAIITATPSPKFAFARRTLKFNTRWVLAAAAILILFASNVFWALRLNAETRQKDALSTQVAQLVANTSGVDPGAAPVFVTTGTGGLRWVRLPSSQQNTNTAAFMMWNAESKTGLLYASNFPSLAAGTTYQLWLRRGDTRTSAGVFSVDEKGKGALLFHSEDAIDQFVWAWITVETGGGSTIPGKQVIVAGALAL